MLSLHQLPSFADLLSSGTDHVVALMRGGKVLTWGTGEQGQLGRVGARPRAKEPAFLVPQPVLFKAASRAGKVSLHKCELTGSCNDTTSMACSPAALCCVCLATLTCVAGAPQEHVFMLF